MLLFTYAVIDTKGEGGTFFLLLDSHIHLQLFTIVVRNLSDVTLILSSCSSFLQVFGKEHLTSICHNHPGGVKKEPSLWGGVGG